MVRKGGTTESKGNLRNRISFETKGKKKIQRNEKDEREIKMNGMDGENDREGQTTRQEMGKEKGKEMMKCQENKDGKEKN